MTNFISIELSALDCVTGGAAKPAAPAPTPTSKPVTPATPAQTPPAPQHYIQQPGPRSDDAAPYRNAMTCARVGGPILGAICGALTPTPAY